MRIVKKLMAPVLVAVLLVACKNANNVQPGPGTIVGQSQYVESAGSYGVIAPTTALNLFLTFNADSTCIQVTGGNVTASGSYSLKNRLDIRYDVIRPAITFSTLNNFNQDSWDAENYITFKSHTLMLTSTGTPAHGGQTIQVFKRWR